MVSFLGSPCVAEQVKTDWPPLEVPQSPLRIGSLPVTIAAREGVQIAWAEYHWGNIVPSFASASMCGVSVVGALVGGGSKRVH